MIGLVLVTHGRLAEEFRNAVEHVVGPQENFETVSIGADEEAQAAGRKYINVASQLLATK